MIIEILEWIFLPYSQSWEKCILFSSGSLLLAVDWICFFYLSPIPSFTEAFMLLSKFWIHLVITFSNILLIFYSPLEPYNIYSKLVNLFLKLTAAKSFQSCPTLCDPTDSSPPGSPVPGILQARTLEWVAISFSNAWRWKVKVKLPSCVWLLATPRTAAYQAPLSMGFSRQEYWSGVPLPSPVTCARASLRSNLSWDH